MEGPAQLKRKAKGQRPTFFDNPDTDKLVSMLMGLAGEVSVMRDRMDTVERLLGEKGLLSLISIISNRLKTCSCNEPKPESCF